MTIVRHRAGSDKGNTMPRYLVQAPYTGAALGAMAASPQDRTPSVRAALVRVGAQLESLDFTLGDNDVIGVFSVPDDTTAAVALAICPPGHVRAYRTTRLLSAAEYLEAQRKARNAGHQGSALG